MDDILKKWDRSLSAEQFRKIDLNIERRSFLANSVKTATAITVLPVVSFLAACSEDSVTTQQELIDTPPWNTFAAVQQQLFPDDGNGPGAAQINATSYLKFVLDSKDTDPDDREFIFSGVDWLNDLSNKEYQNNFHNCDTKQPQAILTKIAKSNSGERWLSYLLLYIFEALLTDPVYGGNPNGVGWQWLQHQPGFPSPPANKRYMDLQ